MSQAYEQTPQTRRHLKAAVWKNDASDGAPEGVSPEDAVLRAECSESLMTFLLTCFPQAFCLEMSPKHIEIISSIQARIDNGGLKAIAMPRGSGKTSILLRASKWAVLTGRSRFICLVAADEATAVSNLGTIKQEILHNEMLHRLYPRETWCIRQLGNEPRRSATQHYEGELTGVEYGRNEVCFGTIPGSSCSGARISTAGITGKIRGQQALTQTGEIIRPDFVLIDDPQTKTSAGSATQCKKRHETMMGDILGLAGPGVSISGFATMTVIYQNDLADRLLDRTQSADWNGDKVAMIQQWPKSMVGWDEYNSIRVREITDGDGTEESTKFVHDNFERLHEGAEVYWEARKGEADVSALHHAMNLYYRDQGVFAAEFQNSPLESHQKTPYDLNIDTLCRRIVGHPRGVCPDDTDKITAFIDTQRELLYYTVVAWSTTGRGYVIDYGACPDQQRHYWAKSSIGYTLAQYFGDDFETYLRSGLDWLTKSILENEYTTGGSTKLSVDRLAIDARWGESTEIIRRFIADSPLRARIHASMGMYVGANSKKWQQIKSKTEKRAEKRGVHAALKTPKHGGRRELLYDTNYWKSFCADRLLCETGSPKAILLFHAPPHLHRMFAEHCAHEQPTRVIGKANNEVVEWKQRESGSPENDYWDCLVGNAALASTIGVQTHFNNQKTGSMSAAIQRVLKNKPKNQFFRDR